MVFNVPTMHFYRYIAQNLSKLPVQGIHKADITQTQGRNNVNQRVKPRPAL